MRSAQVFSSHNYARQPVDSDKHFLWSLLYRSDFIISRTCKPSSAPLNVLIHSLTLIYSKCQDIRFCVVECLSHLIL